MEIRNKQQLEAIVCNINKGNLFIGNGFNLALGVNTSYESLFKSLVEYNYIKKMFSAALYKQIKNNGYNLEAYQDGIENKHCRSAIMAKFYETILRNCRVQYRHKETVDFLLNFSNFFTINYDPLLYRFLLQSKEISVLKSVERFYIDLKKIHDGELTDTGFDNRPLKSVSKKQVYDFARDLFKRGKLHKDKKRDDYYNVLKDLRKEKTIRVNDGFLINQSNTNSSKKYKVWDYRCPSQQNIFYLHGALHIYQKNGKVMKLILSKGSRDKTFINHILAQGRNNSCVFETTYKKKLDKIKQNIYLKACLRKLRKIKGTLFIIGWSCSKNDKHLINVINKSNVANMYISYYCNDTKERFCKSFPQKNLIFFHSNVLPFAKKY